MRARMSLVSSTGESLRLRKRREISSMEEKARSDSVVGGTVDLERKNLTQRSQRAQKTRRREELEDFFLAAEITEGADVGDDEGGGETIFGADLAEVDAAVFEGEAAAVSVVADLDELALEGLVGEVVADAGSEVETLAGEIAVAEEGA